MSAESNKKSHVKSDAGSAGETESQGQRWAKYGSNVVLMVVLAIVLAGLVTYIAEANNWRVDTTAGGINSLRPQTRNVLHDLNTDIKLISLYSKTERGARSSSIEGPRTVDRAGMVADLLDNYHRANSHITVEVIDPNDKARLDALQSEMDQRYGGKDIGEYKSFLDQYNTAYTKLLQLITAETQKIGAPGANEQGGDDVASQIHDGLNDMLRWLRDNKADVDRHLKKHRPDYRGITSSIRGVLQKVSEREKGFIANFQKLKSTPQIPAPVREYMTTSQPQQEQIQKGADEQIAKIDKLGELKVDELHQAMDVPNPILVLGPTQWRVLSESQVWPENKAVRGASEGMLVPNFAGEQQITTAIIGLTATKKPKVAFLRPGGAPLTNPGFPPFQAGGPFSDIADRLRQYNFDVLEKDLSGQWAMQAQAQQQMAAPEPSWDELKDAVWIIIDPGTPIQGADPVGMHLAEHLGHGGSAVLLFMPPTSAEGTGGPDPFASTVQSWGIDIHPEMMAVHEQPPAAPNPSSDPFQDFLRRPFVWNLRDYGDVQLARPIRNLESLMILVAPVTTHDVSGYTVQKLLPLPDAPAAPKSWGQKNFRGILDGGAPKFDPLADMPGPLFAGAVSEKKGGGRLVTIGSIFFVTNNLLEEPDQNILHTEGRVVARFPGNGELAMNSVFWCAKMDSMIALSPAALQVSRISNMSNSMLSFWRVGILLLFLPLAVILGGVGMYVARRD
jgi:hypothetical protein